MPTEKPRLMVTLEQRTYDVLKRLSAVQRRPASAIVREVLDGSTDMLSDIADTMEALERAQEAARARIGAEATAGLDEAASTLQPHLEGILGHFRALAALASDFVDEAGLERGGVLAEARAPQRSEERTQPPARGAIHSDPQPVIRGSESSKRLKSLKRASR